MQSVDLLIASYNIHKGFSYFNRRMVVHELRDRLRTVNADIVFLQEVQGEHAGHARQFHNWPGEPQYEFLADSVWPEFAYGRNAVYDHGHHGNAILSRYPIIAAENQDISAHPFESRGLLHCEVRIPKRKISVHCVCVHFALVQRVVELVPDDAPLVIAGDFNDWRNRAGRALAAELGVHEVFRDHRGRPARSYPARMPILRLDRIYVRGFSVHHAEVHHGHPWSRISDHAMLSARLAVG